MQMGKSNFVMFLHRFICIFFLTLACLPANSSSPQSSSEDTPFAFLNESSSAIPVSLISDSHHNSRKSWTMRKNIILEVKQGKTILALEGMFPGKNFEQKKILLNEHSIDEKVDNPNPWTDLIYGIEGVEPHAVSSLIMLLYVIDSHRRNAPFLTLEENTILKRRLLVNVFFIFKNSAYLKRLHFDKFQKTVSPFLSAFISHVDQETFDLEQFILSVQNEDDLFKLNLFFNNISEMLRLLVQHLKDTGTPLPDGFDDYVALALKGQKQQEVNDAISIRWRNEHMIRNLSHVYRSMASNDRDSKKVLKVYLGIAHIKDFKERLTQLAPDLKINVE